MTSEIPSDLAAAIALGGEMGKRFGDFDWDSHPLGPLPTWPPEVRATVAVALTSRFPILMWLDENDLFLVYNDAYAPVLGERHPNALGRAGREVWWDVWDSIGPMLRGVIDSGSATWSADLLLPLVSGGRPEERYFTFSYSPLIFADGHVGGVFCAVSETTERVLGERRLSTLNTLGAALMEITTVDDAVRATIGSCEAQPADLPFVAVYVTDPTGEQGLHGASSAVAEVMPTSLREFVADSDSGGASVNRMIDDVASRLPGLAKAFAAGCPERAIVIGLPETGLGIGGSVVVGLNPRRPLDEQYEGFCRLFVDQVARALVSARSHEFERERADALAELDRAKTAFLANVSHEFRTPLTLLLGPIEDAMAALQASGSGVTDEQLERLTTAHRNARRLLRLVNALLDFSRVESGTAAPDLVSCDLGEFTAQIASSFSELCARAGLELRLDCGSATAEVDPRMWETIVLNLMSNAVKFTFTGSISVHVRASDGDRVTVQIADTGIGIPPADLDRLFDRFFRASNPRARTVEGSGIGMSLVRSLVDSQGGTIRVDSEVDLGTTVTIELPAAAPATSSGASLPRPARGDADAYVDEALQWLAGDSPVLPEAGGRQLVLVVDDNADMRRHLERVLSERWDTLTVGDADSALAVVRKRSPDLVVTDVMMPGIDGLDFVARLRADPQSSSVPVIMLSARAGLEAAGEGLARGADDYLVKPFRSVDLVNRVAARLEVAARERSARWHDREEARDTAALADLAAALSVATSVDDALAALLTAPLLSMHAGAAAIGLLDAQSRQIVLHYAGDIAGEIRDRYHAVATDAPIPLADVVHTGTSMVIPDMLELDERYRSTVEDISGSVRACIIEPLRNSAGAAFGALALLWPAVRSFSPSEVELVERVAELTAAAVARILTAERDHRIAVDFQEQLLDLDVRSTAATVAGIYQPAAETMRVGGDWYLALGLDTLHDAKLVGVSVGDVVGHGLPAATVMSRLRSALATAALVARDPHVVLDIVERYAATVPGATCATVSYAVVDGHAGTISYACAGHPYPLLVSPDGTATFLQDGRRPPLAARAATGSAPGGTSELPTGSLVILYTDGLIERPTEPLDDGFGRLAACAADCRTLPVDAVCTTLLAALEPAGGYTDDVALLAIRPTGATATSFIDAIGPTSAALPPLRHRLRAWLDDLGIDAELRHDILVTVGEAAMNAIEHGRSEDGRQTIAIEIFAADDEFTASVTDRGTWSMDSSASRRTSDRGRGLSLIYGLCDAVDVVRSNRGTRVTLRHRRSGRSEG